MTGSTPYAKATGGEGPSAHSCGDMLVLGDGSRWGPFTSHWAATAALLRLSDPTFQSLGGDRAIDLAIEADIRARPSLPQPERTR